MLPDFLIQNTNNTQFNDLHPVDSETGSHSDPTLASLMTRVAAINEGLTEQTDEVRRLQDGRTTPVPGLVDDEDEEDENEAIVQQPRFLPITNYPQSFVTEAALRKGYPSLDNVPFEFAHMAMSMLIGKDRLSESEVKSLSISWGSWFLEMPELTLGMLHTALNLYQASKTMDREELQGAIDSEFSKDRQFSLQMLTNTMQNVHAFLSEDPEMCVSFTSFLQNIFDSVQADPEKATIFSNLLTTLSTKPEISKSVVGAGLMLYKASPDQLPTLVRHLNDDLMASSTLPKPTASSTAAKIEKKPDPALVFKAMETGTAVLKTIDQTNTIKLTSIINRTSLVISTNPDLSKEFLKFFNKNYSKEMSKKLIGRLLIVDRTLRYTPNFMLPFLANTMAPSLTPKIWALNGLKERVVFSTLDFFNKKVYSLSNEQLQRLRFAELMTKFKIEFDKTEIISDEPESISIAPESILAAPESTLVASTSTPVEPASTPDLTRIEEKSISIKAIVLTTLKEQLIVELKQYPNGVANRLGERFADATWTVVSEIGSPPVPRFDSQGGRITDWQEMRPLELSFHVTKHVGMAIIIESGKIALSAIAKVSYESARTAIITQYPNAGSYVPSYGVASAAVQLGRSIAQPREGLVEGEEDTIWDRTVSATDEMIISLAGNYIGAFVVQAISQPTGNKVIDAVLTPVRSVASKRLVGPFIGGMISGFFAKICPKPSKVFLALGAMSG